MPTQIATIGAASCRGLDRTRWRTERPRAGACEGRRRKTGGSGEGRGSQKAWRRRARTRRCKGRHRNSHYVALRRVVTQITSRGASNPKCDCPPPYSASTHRRPRPAAGRPGWPWRYAGATWLLKYKNDFEDNGRCALPGEFFRLSRSARARDFPALAGAERVVKSARAISTAKRALEPQEPAEVGRTTGEDATMKKTAARSARRRSWSRRGWRQPCEAATSPIGAPLPAAPPRVAARGRFSPFWRHSGESIQTIRLGMSLYGVSRPHGGEGAGSGAAQQRCSRRAGTRVGGRPTRSGPQGPRPRRASGGAGARRLAPAADAEARLASACYRSRCRG